MHGIVEKMNLKTCELPNFTTVCVRKQQLKVAVWRTLLQLSVDLHDAGDAQAIDATGFDRYSASRHYVNRTDYTFKSVKTTALVDCETGYRIRHPLFDEAVTRYPSRAAGAHAESQPITDDYRRQGV